MIPLLLAAASAVAVEFMPVPIDGTPKGEVGADGSVSFSIPPMTSPERRKFDFVFLMDYDHGLARFTETVTRQAAARRRIEFDRKAKMIDVDDSLVVELAKRFISPDAIPSSQFTDALHVAVATV